MKKRIAAVIITIASFTGIAATLPQHAVATNPCGADRPVASIKIGSKNYAVCVNMSTGIAYLVPW